MAKLTISDFTSLANESSFLTSLNTAFTAVETALENTLSRDGTVPNSMSSDFDMNSYAILNARSIDVETLLVDGNSIQGMRWRGDWATSTSYDPDDVVAESGSSYICILAHTSAASTRPGTGASWATYWDLAAEKGDTGSEGSARTELFADPTALRAYTRESNVEHVILEATHTARAQATLWTYDSSDTTSEDNGFSVIVGADAARWKRAKEDMTEWEALVEPYVRELKADSGPLVVIATGQSDILGSNNDAAGDGATTNSNVKMWDLYSAGSYPSGTDDWIDSEPGVGPMNSGQPTPNNFVHNFGLRLYEETGRTVYIIMRGYGNTSIVEWTDSYVSYDRVANFDAHVVDAFASTELTSAGKTTADFFLFHQGQNDTDASGYTKATYAADWIAMYQKFVAKSWWPRNGCFLVGELGHNTAFDDRNDFIQDVFAYNLPYVNVIKAHDLPVDSTGAHFTGKSYRELGYNRCWEAALRAIATRVPYFKTALNAGDAEFETPDRQPVAMQTIRDVLQLPEDGGLLAGTSVKTAIEGKLGYRIGIPGAVLADGDAATVYAEDDNSGGLQYITNQCRLPSTVEDGYAIWFWAVANGDEIKEPDGTAFHTFTTAGDTLLVVCQDSASDTWIKLCGKNYP